jgi:hypothetical protein
VLDVNASLLILDDLSARRGRLAARDHRHGRRTGRGEPLELAGLFARAIGRHEANRLPPAPGYQQIRGTQESDRSSGWRETSAVTGERIDRDSTLRLGEDHPSELWAFYEIPDGRKNCENHNQIR